MAQPSVAGLGKTVGMVETGVIDGITIGSGTLIKDLKIISALLRAFLILTYMRVFSIQQMRKLQ